MNLYYTADKVGQANHGGGQVTGQEYQALCDYSKTRNDQVECFDREALLSSKVDQASIAEYPEPWMWDRLALLKRDYFVLCPKLAHFYAGCFTDTVAVLNRNGCKVSYTAAAHNIEVSKREHEKLGIPFNYPHLTEPDLWKRYVGGYVNADLVICPSSHSKLAMESYGCKRVEIIPHGIFIPDSVRSLPNRFTVGYLGSCGAPDKGVCYLLAAWKKLDYKDATLVLAGRDSTSDWVQHLARTYGGGNIALAGWINNLEEFYNNISLYCQPSCSEGFGIEILEGMGFARPIIASTGAGASELLPYGLTFEPANVEQLAGLIDELKRRGSDLQPLGLSLRESAKKYEWGLIRQQYLRLWKGLVA